MAKSFGNSRIHYNVFFRDNCKESLQKNVCLIVTEFLMLTMAIRSIYNLGFLGKTGTTHPCTTRVLYCYFVEENHCSRLRQQKEGRRYISKGNAHLLVCLLLQNQMKQAHSCTQSRDNVGLRKQERLQITTALL